jgi:hypothetical protein
MSSDGFKVFMADLLTASNVFQEQSGVLGALMPVTGPAHPDGGSSDINQALLGAADTVGLLNTQLTVVLAQHAERLQAAHQTYSKSDTSVSKLAYEITDPGDV